MKTRFFSCFSLLLSAMLAAGLWSQAAGAAGPAPAIKAHNFVPIQDLSSVGKVVSHKVDDHGVTLQCEGGVKVRLDVAHSSLVRVRVALTGQFADSLMVNSGFVKEDWPASNFTVRKQDGRILIQTDTMRVTVNTDPFAISLSDAEGNRVLEGEVSDGIAFGKANALRFKMAEEEQFFGFGFMRSTLSARGQQLTWKRGFRWKGATVPFFMSTQGYGFYSNNTWDHHFDFRENDANRFRVDSVGGAIDFFLFYGPTFRDILKSYTGLTGQSWMVPRWAFSAQYRGRYLEYQHNMLDIARTYRELEIPCGIMALEPGWEEVPYKMNWKWSPERFPDPAGMLAEMKEMGFEFDLWESGAAPKKGISDAAVRNKWYDLRREAIDMGVRMFKQDDPYPRSIKSTELEAAVLADNTLVDRLVDPRELVNISNSLYTETLFEKFREQTNERAVVMFHAYNASVASHRWPFQWAGDFQAGNGMINASLSGHAMVSYDIRNPYPAGWHQGFFTPFTVVDSWAYYREPWLYSDYMLQSHRKYACLRSRLVPYIYTSLWQARQEGVPIMRPMTLDYSDDSATHQMKSQYFFGDWLLVGLSESEDAPAGTNIDHWTGVDKGRRGQAYLPEGTWIDYWSGDERVIDKAQWVYGEWPTHMGGMLWVKAGAIIPMGQVKNYETESKDEVVVLDVYPHGESSYQLYEDDGITYDYEKSVHAVTDITSIQSDDTVQIKISARQGKYNGMPELRTHLVKMHSLVVPTRVELNGQELPYVLDPQDLIFDTGAHGWSYDAETKKAIIKADKGWQFANQTLDQNPLATIPPTASYEKIAWADGASVKDMDRNIKVYLPAKPVLILSSGEISLQAGSGKKTVEVLVPGLPGFSGSCVAMLDGPAAFANGKKKTKISFKNGRALMNVTAGRGTGRGFIRLTGADTADVTLPLTVFGESDRLDIDSLYAQLLVGGQDSASVRARLYDADGMQVETVTSPILLYIKDDDGQVLTVAPQSGQSNSGLAFFDVRSTEAAGAVTVWAEHGALKSKPMQIESKLGRLQVNLNPPEAIRLLSDGKWLPKKINAFVSIRVGDRLVRTAKNLVTLTITEKGGAPVDVLEGKADLGELVFKDVAYTMRPEKYLFSISSPGFETVDLKVFHNTWDK